MKSLVNWLFGLIAISGVQCATLIDNATADKNIDVVENVTPENSETPEILQDVKIVEKSISTPDPEDPEPIFNFERVLQLIILIITALLQWFNSRGKLNIFKKKTKK